MVDKSVLDKEAEAFDNQVDERIKNGFIPDLRRLKKVEWFYNNVWREPEFVEISLMPEINFVLRIAKKKGGKVLELGCGYGYLTLELARLGLDTVGVDISPKSIEIAQKFADDNPFKEGFGSLKYKCGNILSMNLGIEEFDTIIFFGTLHHMPEIDLVLSKVSNALKHNGNLIVCEPLRNKFTKKSAEFAAILRAILPTWIPYEEKLRDLDNSESWQNYVEKIFGEYTYSDEYEQSPLDNTVSSEEIMLNKIKEYFSIKMIEHCDAFASKIIGGLRGEHRHTLAKFIQFLDNQLTKERILPSTGIRVHATKK